MSRRHNHIAQLPFKPGSAQAPSPLADSSPRRPRCWETLPWAIFFSTTQIVNVWHAVAEPAGMALQSGLFAHGSLIETQPSFVVEIIIQAVLLVATNIGLMFGYFYAWNTIVWPKKWRPGRFAFHWSMFGFLLLLACSNQLIFPGSRAMPQTEILLLQKGSLVLLAITLPLPIYAISAAVSLAIRRRPVVAAAAAAILIVDSIYLAPVGTQFATEASQHTTKPSPNIIVIGIDSLRADFIRSDTSKPITPNIKRSFSDSIRFVDTLTPIARTHPAWTTILTGLEPVRHNVRDNLAVPDDDALRSSIARALKSEFGYQTSMIYDETRFAYLDHRYGFDAVVSPPMGVRDFLFGSVVDSIGTNLLSLVPASRHLMPATYANRGASTIYRPQRFSDEFSRHLMQIDRRQPQFIAVHLCGIHWPFFAPGLDWTGTGWSAKTEASQYNSAAAIVDGQFEAIWQTIERSGLLDDAVVVLLSDHGEALGGTDDIGLVGENDRRTVSFRGHGATAFVPASQNVALAFQAYKHGKPLWNAEERSEAATLADVAPTILGLLGRSTSDMDGRPLLSTIDVLEPIDDTRFRFTESAMTPKTLTRPQFDAHSVVRESAQDFVITEDLRLQVGTSSAQRSIRARQRAVWAEGKILSTFEPDGDVPKFALLSPSTTRTGILLALNEVQADANLDRLRRALCLHYAADEDAMRPYCPRS